MEENTVLIAGEIFVRLSQLMRVEQFGAPPRRLRDNRPKSIFIGKATKEQQAIILLYNNVRWMHERMHAAGKLPYGINPYVDYNHYRQHVMIPILFEMLQWSVHRDFPEQKTNLHIRLDADWNMYGMARPRERKKKPKPPHNRSK